MKVLFAVSSESISDAIIKRYQKQYKEILSYKNVYYFNAILKEIQKDKSYDRIVISEDLEPFSNNNYDTIDKFIFEKLDNISDEAQDSQGKETSIILICTDRRTKGSSFLVKIFGIGVYNALLGNERSMEQVCKLIHQPRLKKEAKLYYKIDADDVSYAPNSEKEVSELEIQNILTHFKKIAKNRDKYAQSFDNIASQYTDDQLRIIINCLPMNVKAVLEEDSPKYQELMSASGGIQRVGGRASLETQEAQEKTGIKIDILENRNHAAEMSGPIVIPSSVKTSKNKRLVQVKPVANTTVSKEPEKTVKEVPTMKKSLAEEIEEEDDDDLLLSLDDEVLDDVQNIVEDDVNDDDLLLTLDDDVLEDEEEDTDLENVEEIVEDDEDNDFVLPLNDDMEDDQEEIMLDEEEDQDENLQLDYDDEEKNNTNIEKPQISIKRGRGRPKKVVTQTEEKPKGKRGRPKKNLEEIEEEDDDSLLLTLDDEEELENTDEPLTPSMFAGEDDEEDALNSLEAAEEENVEEVGEIEDDELTDEVSLPGIDDLDDFEDYTDSVELDYDDDDLLPGIETEEQTESNDDDTLLDLNLEDDDSLLEDDSTLINAVPQEVEEPVVNQNRMQNAYTAPKSNAIDSIKPQVDYSMSSLNSLITKDKKIVTFIGTTKNGTSFLINNLAALFSSLGINTAILDMTQNRNSYYIYTKNEEELRKIAYTSIEKLQNGFAEGIKVDKNLTVYTALPNDGKDYSNAEPILSTLVQNHSLILIDCDFETDPSYFASCQEIYLVQSMDILTIQPLTLFLRDLKAKGVLESEKVRVVINKEIRVRSLTSKVIIGGMSFYNDPAMSFMTELFNKDMVKACSIPFEDNAYSKYLDAMVNCNVSLNGYSKAFLSKLRILGDMVYPLTSKQTYSKSTPNYAKNTFSSSMNNTLNQMKNKY